MYSDPECTPPALLHNIEHNKVLHDRTILLSIKTNEVPYVPIQKRVEVQHLENDFYRVILCYGFMEDPDVPRDLALAKQAGLAIELDQVSYFLGRERLLPTRRPGMAIWREQLFVLMSRNARDAADFFRLPPDQVVELGVRVEM
jgi:KUP system potassium uptake protein